MRSPIATSSQLKARGKTFFDSPLRGFHASDAFVTGAALSLPSAAIVAPLFSAALRPQSTSRAHLDAIPSRHHYIYARERRPPPTSHTTNHELIRDTPSDTNQMPVHERRQRVPRNASITVEASFIWRRRSACGEVCKRKRACAGTCSVRCGERKSGKE
jgi:hypothetical protein